MRLQQEHDRSIAVMEARLRSATEQQIISNNDATAAAGNSTPGFISAGAACGTPLDLPVVCARRGVAGTILLLRWSLRR